MLDIEEKTMTIGRLFAYDSTKAILLISIFIFVRILIKNRLNKGAYSLPNCLNCGEKWSFPDALKNSIKSREMGCPYCGYQQYRTKKSVNKMNMLIFIVPFGILAAQLFNHTMLGFFVYTACALLLLTSSIPYMIELQKENPMNEPFY